ncbi:uncharacterized protein LOC143203976 [Rhynchophorus ferrugineus]|uniref:uncharacterized protein LOC143203976 n=1 Tax=Rhynchophorus ferrugineus TaxID=354439 RepID=UPI003FCCD008
MRPCFAPKVVTYPTIFRRSSTESTTVTVPAVPRLESASEIIMGEQGRVNKIFAIKHNNLSGKTVRMSENFKLPEPEWILDQNGNGPMFWRRDISDEQNSRVKFKHDVEIKEFYRKPHELLEPLWAEEIETSNVFTTGLACVVCLTVSLVLPWYILGGTIY